MACFEFGLVQEGKWKRWRAEGGRSRQKGGKGMRGIFLMTKLLHLLNLGSLRGQAEVMWRRGGQRCAKGSNGGAWISCNGETMAFLEFGLVQKGKGEQW